MTRSAERPCWITMAALILCARSGAAGEIRVEAEGQRFEIGAIGASPLVSAGADIDNSLHLTGLAPALSLGLSLGPTRRVELRWRGLRADHAYASADPGIVLQGEQRATRQTLDALLVQKLGSTPLRFELGYRYLGLEHSWIDAVDLGSGLIALDYASDLGAHGLRGALALDARFMWGQESLRVRYTDDGEYPSSRPDRVSHATRQVGMADVLVRLRVDLGSRVWLATGYRAEAWNEGEHPEFSASGLVLSVDVSLGRP